MIVCTAWSRCSSAINSASCSMPTFLLGGWHDRRALHDELTEHRDPTVTTATTSATTFIPHEHAAAGAARRAVEPASVAALIHADRCSTADRAHGARQIGILPIDSGDRHADQRPATATARATER